MNSWNLTPLLTFHKFLKYRKAFNSFRFSLYHTELNPIWTISNKSHKVWSIACGTILNRSTKISIHKVQHISCTEWKTNFWKWSLMSLSSNTSFATRKHFLPESLVTVHHLFKNRQLDSLHIDRSEALTLGLKSCRNWLSAVLLTASICMYYLVQSMTFPDKQFSDTKIDFEIFTGEFCLITFSVYNHHRK